MDKSDKLFSPSVEATFRNEIELMSQALFTYTKCTKAPIDPPKNLRDFEDRLLEVEEKLRNMVFGLAYDMDTGKTLKREKTSENLVNALCNYEKYVKGVIHEQLDPIGFLKGVIERDAPLLVCDDEYIFGVRRDRSGLFLTHKNKIAIQAAAQVLWYLEKNKIPTIDVMTKCLQNKNGCLYSLLEIERFQSSRTIEGWIREVFPMPKDLRKGRSPKSGISEEHFNQLISIPEVILDNGKMINFLKLRFAVICFSRVLKALGWSIDQIEASIFIQAYKPHLKFYLWMYVQGWIRTAVMEIGSIFDA